MKKRTEFQFSAPVEIPGKVLAPGKYVFELPDNSSDLNLVQVFSEDSNGKESLVATIQAIPDYVSNTPDKPLIHFEERPSGSSEAIHRLVLPRRKHRLAVPLSQSVEFRDIVNVAWKRPHPYGSADFLSPLKSWLSIAADHCHVQKLRRQRRQSEPGMPRELRQNVLGQATDGRPQTLPAWRHSAARHLRNFRL